MSAALAFWTIGPPSPTRRVSKSRASSPPHRLLSSYSNRDSHDRRYGLPTAPATDVTRPDLEKRRASYRQPLVHKKLSAEGTAKLLSSQIFQATPINTKIGLSSGALTMCCSLRDELPSFVRSENDRPLLENWGVSRDLIEGGCSPIRNLTI